MRLLDRHEPLLCPSVAECFGYAAALSPLGQPLAEARCFAQGSASVRPVLLWSQVAVKAVLAEVDQASVVLHSGSQLATDTGCSVRLQGPAQPGMQQGLACLP